MIVNPDVDAMLTPISREITPKIAKKQILL